MSRRVVRSKKRTLKKRRKTQTLRRKRRNTFKKNIRKRTKMKRGGRPRAERSVRDVLTSAGLEHLVVEFDKFGYDDVEQIKDNFGAIMKSLRDNKPTIWITDLEKERLWAELRIPALPVRVPGVPLSPLNDPELLEQAKTWAKAEEDAALAEEDAALSFVKEYPNLNTGGLKTRLEIFMNFSFDIYVTRKTFLGRNKTRQCKVKSIEDNFIFFDSSGDCTKWFWQTTTPAGMQGNRHGISINYLKKNYRPEYMEEHYIRATGENADALVFSPN